MWDAGLVPRKIAFDKNSFFFRSISIVMYINLQFFQNCFSLKVPLNIRNAFSKTLSETSPGKSGQFFGENFEKIINSQFTPFSKIIFQYARRKVTSDTIWFPSKLNLLCSEWDSLHLKSMFFSPTFSFLIF